MMSVKPMSITRVCAVTLSVLVLGAGMVEAKPRGNWDNQGLGQEVAASRSNGNSGNWNRGGSPVQSNGNPSNGGNQGTRVSQHGGGQRGPGGLMQNLNLSQQQQQEIQGIRDRYESQFEQNRNAMEQAREQLRTLMTGDANDSQIRAQHQQVQQLAQQMGHLHFESMMEIRNVLDASQRKQFGEMMNQRRDRLGSGPENGPGNRRGNR